MRPALLSAVAAVVISACAPPSYPPTHPSSLLGKPLPALHHLRTVDGATLSTDDARGKPVVVKFFAQWCVPCMKTLPEAERIHREHPEVAFFGIDEDDGEDGARALVTRFGLTFPVIHDTGNALSGRFRVASLPTTAVADRQGTLRWIGGEEQTGDALEQAVEAALASPVSPPPGGEK
jgi:thiol-disulfide isomerase/thioredoxin